MLAMFIMRSMLVQVTPRKDLFFRDKCASTVSHDSQYSQGKRSRAPGYSPHSRQIMWDVWFRMLFMFVVKVKEDSLRVITRAPA